jgi:hypothetical protein
MYELDRSVNRVMHTMQMAMLALATTTAIGRMLRYIVSLYSPCTELDTAVAVAMDRRICTLEV